MLIDPNELLEKSPLAIVICDKSSRILWCNTLFITQTGLSREDVIGHLYLSLPIEEIDENGKYVQLFLGASNQQVRFQHWQENSNYSSEETIIHYFVFERDDKQKQDKLSEKGITYRLPKQTNWLDFLDYEVSRSRRYDNPMSVLKLHCLIVENPDDISQESIQRLIKSTLMTELRWADVIAHTELGSYLMILPETPNEAVISLQEKLSLSIKHQFELEFKNMDYQLVFADASWRKNDDSKRLLLRARTNLVKKLEDLLANTPNNTN